MYGTNALYVNPYTRYAEAFIGLENIFKLFRIDFVTGFQNGYKPVYTYRFSFSGLLGSPINTMRFGRRQRLLSEW